MAAQYGCAVFVLPGGVTMEKDLYFDDTAGNPVRWDGGSGATATSDTGFQIPVNGTTLIDIVLAAATAQTKTQVNRDNTPTGNMLRNSIHLASVVTRPPMRVTFNAGQKCTLYQVA